VYQDQDALLNEILGFHLKTENIVTVAVTLVQNENGRVISLRIKIHKNII
jgi:hypothetical protein